MAVHTNTEVTKNEDSSSQKSGRKRAGLQSDVAATDFVVAAVLCAVGYLAHP